MALDFFAGCLGGCAGVFVGHPLDTVKVHLQTQDSKNPRYRGTIDCLRKIIARDGVRGIYRGVTSPLLGVAGINAIVFGVYGNAQRKMTDPDSLKSHAFAGAMAGFSQSFICSPMELAKSRVQIASDVSKGPLDCLKKIYSTEGFKGVFRGFWMTVSREVPSFSSYFVTYEYMTRSDAEVSTGRMLLAGGLAGVVSWTITYPVDVIKSRMQTDGILSSKYSSSYDCLCKGLKTEGKSFLFRGLTPTILRAFPVNAVTFTVVTWTIRLLNGEHFTVKDTEYILGMCAGYALSTPESALLLE